jgi:hypothetical protein
MKQLLACCLALLAFFAFQNTPAQAENQKLDFALVNQTGYGIKGVYIGPHSSDDWGENLIDASFENGETLDISFNKNATATSWDIKIVWVDPDAPVQWMNCKLSGIAKFTMHYNRDTGETSAETE